MQVGIAGGTPEGLELLLDRVATGDQTSMGDLFDAVAPGLAILLERIVATDDRDEIMRRTFVDVWRDAPRADRRHGVMGWISTIAIGHARSARRSLA